MRFTAFAIKVSNRGHLEYRHNGETSWDHEVYGATKFDTKKDAEDILNDKIKSEGWGGILQIDEIIISK